MSKTLFNAIELTESVITGDGRKFVCVGGGWGFPADRMSDLKALFENVPELERAVDCELSYMLRDEDGRGVLIVEDCVALRTSAQVYTCRCGLNLWASADIPTKSDILTGEVASRGNAADVAADAWRDFERYCTEKSCHAARATLIAAWREALRTEQAVPSNARISAALAEKIRTAELLYRTPRKRYFCNDGKFYRLSAQGGDWEVVKAPSYAAAYKDGENTFSYDDSRKFIVADGCVTGGEEVRRGVTYAITPYEWHPECGCYSNASGCRATVECWKNKLWD